MAAAAAMIGGGMVSAYGQLYQGQAMQKAAEYNAKIAEENAVLSRKQAAEDERRFRATFKRQLGDMRASYGASGITLEGSPLEVLEDSAAQAELDALTIREQGNIRARGFENEARLQRFQGQAGVTGSYFGAAASLLNAGAQASNYSARRTG